MRPRNQYGDEMCITEMCMELHFGPDNDERAMELEGFLWSKVHGWTPRVDDRFSQALLEFIKATLAEDRSKPIENPGEL